MKIDFTATLKDLDGSPLTDKEKPVTLAHAAIIALSATYTDESAIDGMAKFKRWALARKIHESNGAGVELEVEDVAELKKLIGKAYPPLVVGPAWTLLEGKEPA